MVALWDQTTHRIIKNIGNIGLDFETDLREFDKENSSQRITDGLRQRRANNN
jgi:hypothetical protein